MASVLPAAWTSERMRAFPDLTMLTLYPGNDYLCSVPDVEGSFQDINIGGCVQECVPSSHSACSLAGYQCGAWVVILQNASRPRLPQQVSLVAGLQAAMLPAPPGSSSARCFAQTSTLRNPR